MRKIALIAALTTAVIAPAAQAGRLTIVVTSVALAAKPTDLAPKGTSKGDTIEYRDRLVNAKQQFGRVNVIAPSSAPTAAR